MKILKKRLFKNKKILITGGFGFIGSHLVKRLIQTGAEIHIITIPNTNKFRLQSHLDKIKCYEIDIRDDFAVSAVINDIKPDYVFHMASYGVNSAYSDNYEATLTNVLGSVNIITALCQTGCQKIINMGTCSEYGNGGTDENMPLAPVNIYGSTKAAATTILHQIAKENGLSIVTLRPFGVFGESEEPHKIFAHVIINLLQGNDVPLTKCEQYRDYCYIENIIDAMVLACENEEITNEVFNIASGVSYPLTHYIDLIFKEANTDKKPLYGEVPYRSIELWNPKADVNKIKNILKWELNIPLEEGIKRTIDWYKENFNEFMS